MKALSIERMEMVSGGVSDAVYCGIGVGVAIGTGFNVFAVALAVSLCLSKDSRV